MATMDKSINSEIVKNNKKGLSRLRDFKSPEQELHLSDLPDEYVKVILMSVSPKVTSFYQKLIKDKPT